MKIPDIDPLKELLRDDGARLVGKPKWNRDDDPELYDAIITMDGYFHNKTTWYPEDGVYNIGSSYLRRVNTLLHDRAAHNDYFDIFMSWASEDEVNALALIAKRLNIE